MTPELLAALLIGSSNLGLNVILLRWVYDLRAAVSSNAQRLEALEENYWARRG